MPKVSVLLTSYNHGDYIGESIESILNQTFTDFELVILDDASTDNSVEVIKSYKDKRIKTILRKKNLNIAICKEVIEPLNGEYIAIAHCDDKWEKTKLEKQVKYLDNHKNTAACFTWVNIIDESSNKITNDGIYTNFNVKNRTRYEWLNHFFYNGNCFCHPSVLLRKSIQTEEELYTKGLGALPDMYRWTKLLLKHNIHIIEEELTCFRIRSNGGNVSGMNPDNLVRNGFDLYKLLDLYKSIKDKKEFLKVFPEAKKYMIRNDIITDYALAKMCLEIEIASKNSYRFYALNLLYDLLQDDNTCKKLENMYNYNQKLFLNDVAYNDVFSMIKKEDFMDTSLFIQTNNEFNENNKLQQKVSVVGNKGSFYTVFKSIPKNTTVIRIDIDENVYRVFSELKIIINDKEVNFSGNRIKVINNELVFLTVDPQIIIESSEKIKKVEIKGKTRIIPIHEMENILYNINNTSNKSRFIYMLKRIIKKQEK